MKPYASSLLAGAWLLAFATLPADAQQQETPNLVSVAVLTAAPADADDLAGVIEKVAQAAEMSNLSAKHAWTVHQVGDAFHIVSWPESWADLDTPDAMWQEIGAGEGAALMEEAFENFGDLWVTTETSMADHVEEWTYMPEDGLQPGEHTGAVIFQARVRPGQQEAFSENAAGIMTMLEEMSYPYPVLGHRTLMGEENLTAFVILHDGLENFYGEKSIGQYLEASGMGEAWSEHLDAQDELVYETDMIQATWRPELSYDPEGGS